MLRRPLLLRLLGLGALLLARAGAAQGCKEALFTLGDRPEDRWPEARVAMAHRTGHLEIGEVSVVVAVSCPHRAEAFEACRWGIDRLKESVPIWKKEHAADGTFWIEGDSAVPGTA